MWISEKTADFGKEPERVAEIGKVTVAGDGRGILTDGEVRAFSVLGPGGYYWNMEVGEDALLVRSADGTRIVAGDIYEKAPIKLQPGEVYIGIADGTYIHVRKNGHILLKGNIDMVGVVTVNGVSL